MDDHRRAHGCSRIDLPPVEWDVDLKRIHFGGYMGRHPIAEDPTCPPGKARPHGRLVNAEMPPEDPADGCPAGHVRSFFVASVLPYLRRRDGQGNRVQNLLLDRTDDEVLIALVAYAEDEQERWEAWRFEQSVGQSGPPAGGWATMGAGPARGTNDGPQQRGQANG